MPPAHAQLAATLARADADLRAADALWRSMPAPRGAASGRWIVAILMVTALGTTVLWALVAPRDRPGLSFVFLVLAPSLVVMQLLLEWLAWGAPWHRLVGGLSASVDPRFPEVALCRRCGAPLSILEHVIVARCAYCRADNLVQHPKPAAYRFVRATSAEGRDQLSDAIAAVRMLLEQRKLVRWLGRGMSVALVALLAFALRGS